MREFNRATAPSAPRESAAVILLRPCRDSNEVEVLLQRRHHKASFLASAFVFPGGTADHDEIDPRITAARELFEEAGVLLVRGPTTPERLRAWRTSLNQGTRSFGEIIEEAGPLDLEGLRYFAHWITPSHEPKRFSTRFFLARLPPGQIASTDNAEAVETAWVTPAQALARIAELRLPPPQIRTFFELRSASEHGIDALFAAAEARTAHPHPILPRVAVGTQGPVVLLPWDPEYPSALGEGLEISVNHPLAVGPSRFVLEDMTWRHIDAPSSPAEE